MGESTTDSEFSWLVSVPHIINAENIVLQYVLKTIARAFVHKPTRSS